MSELRFDSVEHKYYYDNCEVPSVSTILGGIDFDNLPQSVISKITYAAERGTRVHNYIEAINRNYDRLEPDSDIKPYIDQYMFFLIDNENYASIQSETKVCSVCSNIPEDLKAYPFAGTVDDICVFGKEKAVIDFKTSSTIKKRHRLQIGAYMLLTGINKGYILHLKKDGYTLKEVPVKYKDMFIEKLKEYYEI